MSITPISEYDQFINRK